jgi:trans-aconitate 2-methyltransferase
VARQARASATRAHSSSGNVLALAIYLQVLDGEDPVVNFMRGTALRPFLSVLSKREAGKFIDAFAERMTAAYPAQPNGQTLFPFRRLFLVAQR